MTEAHVSNKAKATTFLQMITAGNIKEAFAKYVGAGFKHHNPFVAGGDAASLLTAMEEAHVKMPNKGYVVHHVIEDGDTVVVHAHLQLVPTAVDGNRGMIVVHIVRFKDGAVVELWDCGQVIPTDMKNENGPF